MRFPLVRIVDEGLAKRLVKTTDLGRSTLMPEIESDKGEVDWRTV